MDTMIFTDLSIPGFPQPEPEFDFQQLLGN